MTSVKTATRENPFVSIAINIVIPSIILSKLTKPEYLGFFHGVLLAFVFPLSYGVYSLARLKEVNIFSLFGLVNTLFTFLIGLSEMNKFWMIFKETAFPLFLGVLIGISQKTRWPVMDIILDKMIDLGQIREAFARRGLTRQFEKTLNRTTLWFVATFFINAVFSYFLARAIIKGAPGSQEFAQAMADMLKYSFILIGVPILVVTGVVLHFFFNFIKKQTGLGIEQFMRK